MSTDLVIYTWLHHFALLSPFSDSTIIFVAVYLPILMGAIALLFIFFANESREKKLTALITALLSTLVARYVFTALIRLVIHRDRPFTLAEAHSLFKTIGSSFPSGHATVLFAIGMVLYAFDKRAGLVFLIFSCIVCAARVIAGVHYPSDIVAGIFSGLIASLLILTYLTPFIRARIARRIDGNIDHMASEIRK